MSSDQVTSPLLSQALAYLDEGDPTSADLLIDTYVARHPDDARALHIAGLCRRDLGDADGAWDFLTRATKADPADPAPVVPLALLLADGGDAASALKALDEALIRLPGHMDLLLARSAVQRRTGDADGAIASAQMAVAFHSNTARVHHALGLAHAAARDTVAAREAFAAAVAHDPDFADGWINLGVVAKECGDLGAADDSFQKALALHPDDPVIHNNYGNVLLALRRLEDAIASYRRAIGLKPDYVDAKVNLALAYREAGDAGKSLTELEGVVDAHPDHVAALNSLGNALRHAEQFARAHEVLQKAISLDPNHAEAHNNLGLVLTLQGKWDAAESEFAAAVTLRPDMAVLANNFGTLLLKMFKLEGAVEQLTRAVDLEPGYLDALVNLGVAHFMLGHYDDAVRAYRRVIDKEPAHAFARYSLGVALVEQQELEEGVEQIEQALAIDPDNVMALNTLGVALLDQHRISEALAAMTRAAEADTASAPVYLSNALFTSLYDPDIPNDEIQARHLAFGERFTTNTPDSSRPHANPRDPDRKLKLGYMSPDFRGHSVSYFFEPVLEKHDRSQFEIFLYSNTTRTDAVTDAMAQAADVWVETSGLTDDAVVRRIRDDGIDILVNLGGHTSGNRLVACGQKPAPVQIEYVGYPDTSGVRAMDYRIIDGRSDPEGEADARCVETLLRLPDCFHCYRPTAKAPEPAAAPHVERGYVTYGSFNVLPKLNARVVEAWSDILRQVPTARLYMKCKQLKTPAVQERVLGYFADAGIDPARITLEAFVPSVKDHLSRYHGVDLGLDTFPYNGTTTTCEALWMGVPVLSVEGHRHSGRVGLSLLHAAGLHREFAASDVASYIDKAVAWGHEPVRLAEIRSQLRPMMAASPLRDETGFTRNLEALYRDVWRQWCAGPETFEHRAPAPLRADDSVQSVLTKAV